MSIEVKKQNRVNKIGFLIAVVSFLLGTLLLLIFYLSDSFDIAIIGYGFLIVAGIVNLIVLLILIKKSMTDKENRNSYLKTSGLLLLNIPIAIVYLIFVMFLFNTMRINFINKTGKPITEIQITGCESKTIDKLDIDESKTIWIGIPGDCSITIEYKIDDEIKREEVFSYVTNSMGQRAIFRIGNQEKPIDETF